MKQASECWHPRKRFKEKHFATYLAAVTGPGLVLWKSILEPESFSAWKAALTTWFSQFWCISSIIRSASSMIWIHKDKKHCLFNSVLCLGGLYFSFVTVTVSKNARCTEASTPHNFFPCLLFLNWRQKFLPPNFSFCFSCSVAKPTLKLHKFICI